jgi:serine/threonine protein kinase
MFFPDFFSSSFSQTPPQAYEELGKLGEGTYGTVLRCRHRGTKELVAVKRFKESGEENQVSFAFVFFLWRQAGEREG